MSTKPWLEILQTHLQYSGLLSVPSLRLVNDARVGDRLLAELAPYGAQLENFWQSISPQNIALSTVTLNFLAGYASVRLSPVAAEVTFRGPGEGYPNVPFILPQSDLSQIISRIGTIVGSIAEQPSFASHAFTLGLHARLHGQDLKELLGTYVRPAPDALGELQGAGVRYVFSAAGARVASWLVAEPSASVTPNGLYVSCSVTLDATRVSTENAADAARAYLDSIVDSPDCPVRIGDD